MIRLNIELGNAAFEEAGKEYEVARIVAAAAAKIENGAFDFKLFDVNGNSVGWAMETDDGFEPEPAESYVIVEMETGNAAFEDKGFECARILREAAVKIADGNLDFKLLDLNGNTVGKVGEVEGPVVGRRGNEPIDMDAPGALRHVYKYVGVLVGGDRPSKDAADWAKVGSYPDGVVADKVAADLCEQGHFSTILSVGEYSPELRYVLNHYSPSEVAYLGAHPSERQEKAAVVACDVPVQSLYAALKAAGLEMGNHESDLYVPVTPESTAILAKYPTSKANATVFKSNIDGKPNYDVPFAYEPFWQKKSLFAAIKIASQKESYKTNGLVSDQTCSACSGIVMGLTDYHVVLSLGRTALIITQSDMDRVPAKDEEVSVTFKDGKGMVQPGKERGGVER